MIRTIIGRFTKLVFLLIVTITCFFMWYNSPVTDGESTELRTLAVFNHVHVVSNQSKSDMKLKYILIWTLPTRDPICDLGSGQTTFINNKCAEQNCFVSSNRSLFQDVADFDVVVFHGPDLPNNSLDLPLSRSPHQKYIFASMESSGYYPNCYKFYNRYFNWTLTYKLKSDEYYGYIIIRNIEGDIIGPRERMHWKTLESMDPINDTIKQKLSTKTTAAAWFVSNCRSKNHREIVAENLQKELEKYNMTLDIYGTCGTKQCPRNNMNECLQKLETDYYFYLSFENSFSEDYVTEKLLRPLRHYAVPIVYGGANYTRFMPDGIYLDARKLSSKDLAAQMAEVIKDKEKYYSFFKWHNHYTYQSLPDSPETNSYCNLCALINNEALFNKRSIYENFTRWWAPPELCKL